MTTAATAGFNVGGARLGLRVGFKGFIMKVLDWPETAKVGRESARNLAPRIYKIEKIRDLFVFSGSGDNSSRRGWFR